MKVIDLLIKTANGEKVPKKIKYDGIEFEYCEYYKDHVSYTEISSIEIFLIDKILKKNIKPDILLNDEIEIIEEDKKFEDIREIIGVVERDKTLSYDESHDGIVKNFNMLIKRVNILVRNQKKIIDEVNKLKGGNKNEPK